MKEVGFEQDLRMNTIWVNKDRRILGEDNSLQKHESTEMAMASLWNGEEMSC